MNENTKNVDIDFLDDDVQAQESGPEPKKASKIDNITTVMTGPKTSKVVIATVGALIFVGGLAAIAIFSKKSNVEMPADLRGANVGSTPALRIDESKNIAQTPEYKAMVSSVEKERAKQALQAGGSTQPLAASTARDLVDFKTPAELEAERQRQLFDSQTRVAEQAAAASRTQPAAQYQGNQPQYGAQAANANNQQLNERAAQALDSIFTRPRGMETFTVSTLPKNETNSSGGSSAGQAPGYMNTGLQNGGLQNAGLQNAQANQQGAIPVNTSGSTAAAPKLIIAAGTIGAVKTLTGINTDIGGDFVSELLTGPYAGASVVGSYRRVGNLASLTFKSITIKGMGITLPVVATGLDATTLDAATATDVDRKLLVKYGVKPIAAGLAALGTALASSGTTVNVNGAAVTNTQTELSRDAARGVVVGAAAKQLTNDADALDTTPTVRVAPQTVLGIMFTSDVIYTPK